MPAQQQHSAVPAFRGDEDAHLDLLVHACNSHKCITEVRWARCALLSVFGSPSGVYSAASASLLAMHSHRKLLYTGRPLCALSNATLLSVAWDPDLRVSNLLRRRMLSVRSSRLTSRMRLACLRLLRLQGLLQSAPQARLQSANANARTNRPTAWPARLLHVELQLVLDSFRRPSRRRCLCP